MHMIGSRYLYIMLVSSLLVTACGGGGSEAPLGNSTTTSNTPQAPSQLGVQLTAPDYVNLIWSDNSTNESGFTIERKTGVAASYVALTNIAANSVFYKDSTVSIGQTYYYRLKAYNADGSSSYSNEVSTTISGTAPADPTNLSATSVTPKQISLSWNDNADNETTYFLERKTGSNGVYSLLTTLNPDTTSYIDTGLNEQYHYSYRVYASNPWGATGMTNELNIVTPPVASAGLWARTYSGPKDAFARSVINTSDGGFLIAGTLNINSSGPVNNEAWLIKLASDETIEWQKTYGNQGDDSANAVIQTADGGYLIAGVIDSLSTASDAWLVKLNSLGEIQWEKSYGASPDETAKVVVQTDDNGDGNRDDGYILIGNNGATNSAQIIKVDSSGSIEWQQDHEAGFGTLTAYSVQQTADRGYIVTGEIYNSTSTNRDLWVLRLSSTGTITWEKTYAGTDNSGGRKIIQTDDNSDGKADDGFLVAGIMDTDASSTILDAAWVLKLNADGSIAWQETLSGSGTEMANDVIQTQSGKFLVAATTQAFGASSNDDWLIELNSDGSVNWEKRYGGLGGETPEAIQQTPDMGLIAVGTTNSFGISGVFSFWVLRLDSTTNINFVDGINASSQTTSATVSDTTSSAIDRSRNPTITGLPIHSTTATVNDSDAVVQTQSQ